MSDTNTITTIKTGKAATATSTLAEAKSGDNKNLTVFAEFFPINQEALPPLFAYQLQLTGTRQNNNLATMGGKLAYRLRREFGGHWVWTANRLVSDLPPKEEAEFKMVLANLWNEQVAIFKSLQKVKPDEYWQPSPQALADFVARGLLADLDSDIRHLLTQDSLRLGKARLERVHEIRGWVVAGEPALSISVASRVVYLQDLNGYLRANSDKIDSIVQDGLWVADKTSSLKGQLVSVVGKVVEHRERLLALASREDIQEIIEKAADEELVVEVSTGRSSYDYVASALRIVLRTEDYADFGLDAGQLLAKMKLAPAARSTLVKKIADMVKKLGTSTATSSCDVANDGNNKSDNSNDEVAINLSTTPTTTSRLVGNAYTSASHPDLFFSAYHYNSGNQDTSFSPELRFGKDTVRPFDEKTLFSNLRECGLYRRREIYTGKAATPIRIGVVEALSNPKQVVNFCQQLQQELGRLNFKAEFIRQAPLEKVSRLSLERALSELEARQPHIVIGLFPDATFNANGSAAITNNGDENEKAFDDYESDGSDDTDDEEDNNRDVVYQHFKSLTVGKGIPSQAVYASTLSKGYAMNNIMLGILGKTGNVPFVLANPLPYADLIVGIDIGRQRKERLAGSINATAIARIYFGNGDFLRYAIHDAPLEGETVPARVLQSLFPLEEFSGKRVVIHRDGFFRGDEKQVLKDWANQIGAEFHLVEIIKSGSPRMYASEKKGSAPAEVVQPPKGSAFILSETEALLVSSLPPFKSATPQPLRIRTETSFGIENAIHSVLSLTLLHYGSVRAPRLPVTIHYSDKIAYLALRGIKPKNLDGTVPYWL